MSSRLAFCVEREEQSILNEFTPLPSIRPGMGVQHEGYG